MTTRSYFPLRCVWSTLRREESETGLGSGPLRAARAAGTSSGPGGGGAVSPFSYMGGAVHSMAETVE